MSSSYLSPQMLQTRGRARRRGWVALCFCHEAAFLSSTVHMGKELVAAPLSWPRSRALRPLLDVTVGQDASRSTKRLFTYVTLCPGAAFPALDLLQSNPQLDQLPQLVMGVQSLDANVQLETTTAFRKILSIGECALCGSLSLIEVATACVGLSQVSSMASGADSNAADCKRRCDCGVVG